MSRRIQTPFHLVGLTGPLLALAACEFNQGGPSDPGFVPPPPPPILPRPDVVRAEDPPPAISGGTMAIGPDDRWLVAADPDRDQVYVVALDQDSMELVHTIALESDVEPGRVVFTESSRAQVALRNDRRLLTIDLAEGSIVEDRQTCPEPRGLTRDVDQTLVACASGELWWLSDGQEQPSRTRFLEPDLRDVVMSEAGPLVSTFRLSKLIELEEEPRVLDFDDSASVPARVAWRMRRFRSGEALILHQRAAGQGITVSVQEGGYGATQVVREGGIGCSNGIVSTEISRVTADGRISPLFGLFSSGLAVDMAVSDDGTRVAVASPSESTVGAGGVTQARTNAASNRFTCLGNTSRLLGSPSSVEFSRGGELFVLFREPARVVNLDRQRSLELSEVSVADSGHQLFHAVTAAGVACASCHPEGRDDGHVWEFEGIGERRTQVLTGGIMDTAPFHWTGEFRSLNLLMGDVFSSRMGGGEVSSEQIAALGAWMDTLRPLAPAELDGVQDVEAGRAIFHSASVGCANCHDGPRLTGPGSFFVGTDGIFQVPPLEGLVYRAPFMHDGCAETLEARFAPPCGGGDAHGRTAQLTEDQLQKLTAYLRSL
ncbi:MAG: cytochrome-c peroxidase [Myxococcota bacterium]